MQACLLQVPAGLYIEDLGFYRNGQLGLLLATATSSRSGSSGVVDQNMDAAPGNESPHNGPDAELASRLVLVPEEMMAVACVESPAERARGSSLLQVTWLQALLVFNLASSSTHP